MILQSGSLGSDVTRLQTMLAAAGIVYSVPQTGAFDAATDAAVRYFQATHIGSDGAFLAVDGQVTVGGSATWWALEHPTGSDQHNYLAAELPSGLTDSDRVGFLRVLLGEWGKRVQEVPLGSNAGADVLKYGGAAGSAWCCWFMSWCFHRATGRWPTSAGDVGGCMAMLGGAIRDGTLVDRETLAPGDIWIMLFRDANKVVIGHHTGAVLRVSEDGKRINTVEGNCGDRAKCGTRDVATLAKVIRPYATPAGAWARGLVGSSAAVGSDTTV